jgi:hypothetical protein
MPVFPSTEWFNAIKDLVNADPAFRQLGTVDASSASRSAARSS